MSPPDLWNEWVEPFDLFVSYARTDNDAPPRMVSALVEHLEADFARFSPSHPLRVFFDKTSILDMQHWQDVLRKGLRQSKVMLAVLSPAYFASEWCRREWEEYVLVEQARTYPGEALAPIFIVAPAELGPLVPAEARDWWDHVTSQNAVVEVHPFWPNGRAALQEHVVVQRLRRLSDNVHQRVEHGRALARVPRDVRGRNPNFVGRRRELADLRDKLSRFEMVGVCAVNGVGGIGKSAMAREYAYVFRKEYLGGQFEIDLSTVSSARGAGAQLVRIARDYLHADISPQLPEDEQHGRALAAFHRLPPGETALLILDNLNEDAVGIIGQANRGQFPSAEKVHLLVTTRAGPRDLGGMETVSLDVLPVADALDLLFRHRAFARRLDDAEYLAAREGRYQGGEIDELPADAEWKAALAIVNRLGRHALAVALVGAYLGSYPDVSYAAFAADLAGHGIGLALDAVGADERVRALIQHPETLIGPLFKRSVARLAPLALRAMDYAAYLPPDLVPLAWLRELVGADGDMAEELKGRPFRPPAWEEAVRTLAGLGYLTGAPYGRMHRVVQEVVRRRTGAGEGRREAVLRLVERRAVANSDDSTRYADVSEIEAVEQVVRSNAAGGNRLVGRAAMRLVGNLRDLGRLRSARDLARIAEPILKAVAEADPASAEKRRDLSISFDRLGNVSGAAGDLAAARGYYEQYHALARALAEADPASAEKRRGLSISLERLGEISAVAGDLQAARAYFEQALALARALAEADPASAQKRRDLSVSLERLGGVSAVAGDLAAARPYVEQALAIRRALAEADPASAQKRRDLSVSLLKLGEVSGAAGDLAAARGYYEQYHALARALAEADPASAEKRRDLSVSLNKLGEISAAAGDLQAARAYFEQALAIRRPLAEADPASAQRRRELGVSHFKLFDVSTKEGDRPTARRHLQAFVEVWGRLEAEGRLPSPQDQSALKYYRQQLAGWDERDG